MQEKLWGESDSRLEPRTTTDDVGLGFYGERLLRRQRVREEVVVNGIQCQDDHLQLVP